MIADSLSSLTRDQIIYLAFSFSSTGSITNLRTLYATFPFALRLHIWDILNYIPETTIPSVYLPFINELADGEEILQEIGGGIDENQVSEVLAMRPKTILRTLKSLRISTLEDIGDSESKSREVDVDLWIRNRAKQIEEQTGLFDIIIQLLAPFFSSSSTVSKLNLWTRGVVLPVSRFEEYRIPQLSIEIMEKADCSYIVSHVMVHAVVSTISGIMEDILVPFGEYVGWPSIVSALEDWGVEDVTIGKLQMVNEILQFILRGVHDRSVRDDSNRPDWSGMLRVAVGLCYIVPNTDMGIVQQVYRNLAALLSSSKFSPSNTKSGTEDRVDDLTYLTPAKLLNPDNPFTFLNQDSLEELHRTIEATEFINGTGITRVSLRETLDLQNSPQISQEQTLTRILLARPNRNDSTVLAIRRSLLSSPPPLPSLSTQQIEYAILCHLLTSGFFSLAKTVYIQTSPRPLPSETVENAVLAAFYEYFDNATLQTRSTHGTSNNPNPSNQAGKNNMNHARDVLNVLHPKHNNEEIRKAETLMRAIDGLTQCSLSEEILPVQLRANRDPLSVMAKILDGTPRAYRRYQSLSILYRDLCNALDREVDEDALRELCIANALADEDTRHAISLCEGFHTQDSRKKKDSDPRLRKRPRQDNDEDKNGLEDEVEGEQGVGGAWRSEVQVARYPGPNIEARMQILTRAIRACPSRNVAELLTLYISLESEFLADSSLNTTDIGENARIGQGKRRLRRDSSGASSTMGVDAPKSLFEAAAMATRIARQKSRQVLETVHDMDLDLGSASQFYDGGMVDGDGRRVRKRDQIAGLVSGGVGAVESRFTSGLGWLIGADQTKR